MLTTIGIGGSIACYNLSSNFTEPNSVWKYPFQRPETGNATRRIQQEINFYQQRIRQQPAAGLDRAALAQSYLKMARATGESSWYLLAEGTANESLDRLPIGNNQAILVLAKVATARHDFKQSLAYLNKLPPQAEFKSLATTNYLAIGDLKSAKQTADLLVQKMPTTNNLTLKALVEFARGEDELAIKDLRVAIEREEPDEAGSSAWARTLLGRIYYKRGRLLEAEQLYDAALKILPNYAPALLNSAELSVRKWQENPRQTKYQQQAVAIYNRFYLTSQKMPTTFDHTAFRGIARVRLLQGNRSATEDIWQRAEANLRSDLTGFGHQRELAQLLLERGKDKDLAEALTLMEAEIKIRQDAETWDTLAEAYLRLNKLPEARKAIEMALKSGVRDPALFDRAATIFTANKEIETATKYRDRIQSIDPTFNTAAKNAIGLGVGLSNN